MEEFADSCRWLADAYLSEDAEEVVAALCAVYGQLVASGWDPPAKVSTLLRLHGVVVDAALTELVEGERVPRVRPRPTRCATREP